MVRVNFIELVNGPNGVVEENRGWADMPECPVPAVPPAPRSDGQVELVGPPIRVNGKRYGVIGHAWDVVALPVESELGKSRAVLVLMLLSLEAAVSGVEQIKSKLILPN